MKNIVNESMKGIALTWVVMFIVIFTIFGGTVGTMILVTLRGSTSNMASEQALNLADAGINYYMWHLNHNGKDFTDGHGTMTPGANGYGPFVHQYYAMSGKKVGTYTLYIQPVSLGASMATVRSTGESAALPGVKRTIEAKIGAPSFGVYAVASNDALWFGNTESTSGLIHSNVGVKMDGSNTDLVTSAKQQYKVPSWSGNGGGTYKPGVWCDPLVTSPINCQTRSKTSWRYSNEASLDFQGLSTDICGLKRQALNWTQTKSCTQTAARTLGYIPPSSNSYSKTTGYLISLNDDGKTYNLEKVSSEDDKQLTYTKALTRSTVQTNIPIASNGIIFVDDNTWVRTSGPNGFPGRVTIAVNSPYVTNTAKIIISDNVKYRDKYNGSAAIGMIAPGDIEVAPYAGAPLEIDAAVISQKGAVTIRKEYLNGGNNVKGYADISQAITFFGSLTTNKQWTWSVVLCNYESSPSCWSGYRYTNTGYDEKLRFAPPPSFPVTSTFDILGWREVMAFK